MMRRGFSSGWLLSMVGGSETSCSVIPRARLIAFVIALRSLSGSPGVGQVLKMDYDTNCMSSSLRSGAVEVSAQQQQRRITNSPGKAAISLQNKSITSAPTDLNVKIGYSKDQERGPGRAISTDAVLTQTAKYKPILVCTVLDRSDTYANTRSSPNGAIESWIPNHQDVQLDGFSVDSQGRRWGKVLNRGTASYVFGSFLTNCRTIVPTEDDVFIERIR